MEGSDDMRVSHYPAIVRVVLLKARDTIVANMTNFGYPYLVVENGDYRGNRELYLKHMFEGQELDLNHHPDGLREAVADYFRKLSKGK